MSARNEKAPSARPTVEEPQIAATVKGTMTAIEQVVTMKTIRFTLAPAQSPSQSRCAETASPPMRTATALQCRLLHAPPPETQMNATRRGKPIPAATIVSRA
jgi:hypothetical protein